MKTNNFFFSLNYKKLILESKKPYFIICIFTSLIIPLLVSGPFLPDLILSLLVIWFIFFSILNKEFRYYKNLYFKLFFIFWLVCVTSSLLSEDIFFSFQSSLFYFRIGIFACLISFLIDRNKNILKYFYFSFTLTFMALIIDGYFQFIFEKNIFGQELIMAYTTPRVTSFFGDETLMDSFLVRLYPLYFALFVIKKKKDKKEIFLMSLIFFLLDILIYLGGGRTSFFFLNLSTLFVILFISKFKLLRIFVFTLSFIVISLLTISDTRLMKRFVTSPIEGMNLNNNEKKYIFTSGHDSHIRTAFNIFKSNPVLGIGPKMFRVKCNEKKYVVGELPCSTHPHNFYIQLLAETGVIGFIFLFFCFLFLIYITLKNLVLRILNKNNKNILTDYQICILAAFLITLWPFSPNGNFFNNWLMIIYALPVGFYSKNTLKF